MGKFSPKYVYGKINPNYNGPKPAKDNGSSKVSLACLKSDFDFSDELVDDDYVEDSTGDDSPVESEPSVVPANAPAWYKYEVEQCQHLSSIVLEGFEVHHYGGSDSTIPDIRIDTGKESFYVDSKMDVAQAGQFALQYKDGKFSYSSRNKAGVTKANSSIVDTINEMGIDPDKQTELEFDSSNEVFVQHLCNLWREAGVRALITDKVITPIERINENYVVTGSVRPKYSGSSNFGKSSPDEFVSFLSKELGSDIEAKQDGSDLYVYGQGMEDNQRLEFGGRRYKLAKKGDGFRVRKLSDTRSMTVIFKLEFSGKDKEKATEEDVVSLTK